MSPEDCFQWRSNGTRHTHVQTKVLFGLSLSLWVFCAFQNHAQEFAFASHIRTVVLALVDGFNVRF